MRLTGTVLIAFLGISASISGASQAVLSANDRLAKEPAQANQCGKFLREAEKLKRKGESWETIVLYGASLKKALATLNSIHYPTQEQADTAYTALKEDLSKALPPYFKISGTSCTTTRWNLGRALANTAVAKATSSADRERVQSAFLQMIKRPKYPSLIEATIDLSTLSYAFKKEMFANSEKKRQTDQALEDVKLAVKESAEKWKAALGTDIQKLEKEVRNLTPENFAKMLKAGAWFSKIKPVMLSEFEISRKYLAQTVSIAGSL